MSENLAGVTLLAFGNGSPDIFASLSNISGDTELVYAELLGAAIFVTGFIAGIVILIRPFKIVWRNYVRDVLFFLVGAIVIDNFIHDEGYTITEGVCTVMIYVAYLCVVVYEHIRMKRKAQELRQMKITSENAAHSAEIRKKAEVLEEATVIKIYSRKDSSVILETDIMRVLQRKLSGVDPNYRLFQTFLQAISPLDKKEWRDAGWIGKVLMMLKVKKQFSFYELPSNCFMLVSGPGCVLPRPRYSNRRLRRRSSRLVQTVEHAEHCYTPTIVSLHHRIHQVDVLRFTSVINDCPSRLACRIVCCVQNIEKRLSTKVPRGVCRRKFHRLCKRHLCHCKRSRFCHESNRHRF